MFHKTPPKEFHIHLAKSFTPALFVQAIDGWIAPQDAEIQFDVPTRLVVLFLSDCPICLSAACDDAYILGMN
jgi:hypothetical protein